METNAGATKKDLKRILRTMLQIFFSEFFGAGLAMYIGCSGCIIGLRELTFPFAITVATQVVGHISGAHLNPSVTIAAVIVGEIELIYAPIYIIGEFLGAFFGYTLVFLTIFISVESFETANLGVTVVNQISVSQALVVETISTMILVLTYCAFWHARHSTSAIAAAVLGFGLQGIYVGFKPFTGASMNTARSLPPAAINNSWKDHWVYWLGPNLGAILGAGFYKYLLMHGPLTYKET